MEQIRKPYYHTVQYYETDGMRIVHHSNYIRWMEEARTDYLIQMGLPYDEMERRGLLFPVLSASCEYKAAVAFGATVRVEMQLDWFDGLRYEVSYRITDPEGKVLHAVGKTQHCFLNRALKPLRVKKEAPDVYDAFCADAKELRGVAAKDRKDR